jgi:hypothetical protein
MIAGTKARRRVVPKLLQLQKKGDEKTSNSYPHEAEAKICKCI